MTIIGRAHFLLARICWTVDFFEGYEAVHEGLDGNYYRRNRVRKMF